MRRLGFASDAGYRFERGVDFALAPARVERATQLILDICGGRAGPLVDVTGTLPRARAVRVRRARVDAAARRRRSRRRRSPTCSRDSALPSRAPGRRFHRHAALLPLRPRDRGRLDRGSGAPPRLRRDSRRRPATHVQTMLPAPEGTRRAGATAAPPRRARLAGSHHLQLRRVRRRRRALDPQAQADRRAESDRRASSTSCARPSLAGLLEVLRTNLKRKLTRVRIFETGRMLRRTASGLAQPLRIGGLAFGPARSRAVGRSATRPVDFFDVKGDLEALAAPLSLTTRAAPRPSLHPGRSADVIARSARSPAGSANCIRGSSGTSTCRRAPDRLRARRGRAARPAPARRPRGVPAPGRPARYRRRRRRKHCQYRIFLMP